MSNKMKVKAVVFDRDGVIINSDGVLINSVRFAFKQLGFEMPDEDIPQLIGRSFDYYREYFLAKWDFDPEEYRKIQRLYFYENLDKAPFFEAVVELINKLYLKGIPLAVATSARKEGTMLILNNAGIADKFKVIITKDDVKNAKPNPEVYITTANKLGLEPELCVAIEDTSLGVEAAKNAGMKCVAIPNEYTLDQDFSKADAVLKSAKEVEDLLEFVV